MRLLYVAPRLPYPPLKGDQVVVFNRLRILGRRHEITLLTFYERDADLEGVEALRELCARVEAVRLPPWRSAASMAGLGLFTPTPFQILYYRSKRFRRKLEELVREGGFDVANAFLLRMAPYVERLAVPKVLDLIDSMQLAFERRVEVEGVPRRWAFAEELRRVRRYERSVGGAFDELLVVSERDRALVPDQHVTVVPNGIDADAFAPDPARRRSDPTVVFSGNLGFPSNSVAARWFAEHVWPRVLASVPAATLMLVGANPPRSLRDLDGRDGVEVTGFVESMAETLQSAHVAVAPMQSGSGIQNKVLEAMASGLPAVATELGLGGIGAEPGREVLVAEEPEEFAARVIELLRSPGLAAEVGSAGRRFVVEQHSWESAARRVEEIYERLIEGRAAS